jgi:hypothetical protein
VLLIYVPPHAPLQLVTGRVVPPMAFHLRRAQGIVVLSRCRMLLLLLLLLLLKELHEGQQHRRPRSITALRLRQQLHLLLHQRQLQLQQRSVALLPLLLRRQWSVAPQAPAAQPAACAKAPGFCWVRATPSTCCCLWAGC